MTTKLSVASRFVHAKYDNYGTRRGPARGFVLHMAEGDNVWRYLSAGNVARGVSVHFTVEHDGEIVQMLGLTRISGSINPRTLRKTNTKRYGREHGVYALGSWYTNPNNAVISVEVAGRNAEGPNDKQIESIKRLFKALLVKYPALIPLGHADFQSVKPCPGRIFFDKVFPELGGHGKDYKRVKPEPPVVDKEGENAMILAEEQVKTSSNWVVSLPKGTKVYERTGDDNPLLTTDADDDFEYYGYTRNPKGWWAIELKANLADGTSPRVIAYVKPTDAKPHSKPLNPSPVHPDTIKLAALRTKVKELAKADESLDAKLKEALGL